MPITESQLEALLLFFDPLDKAHEDAYEYWVYLATSDLLYDMSKWSLPQAQRILGRIRNRAKTISLTFPRPGHAQGRGTAKQIIERLLSGDSISDENSTPSTTAPVIVPNIVAATVPSSDVEPNTSSKSAYVADPTGVAVPGPSSDALAFKDPVISSGADIKTLSFALHFSTHYGEKSDESFHIFRKNFEHKMVYSIGFPREKWLPAIQLCLKPNFVTHLHGTITNCCTYDSFVDSLEKLENNPVSIAAAQHAWDELTLATYLSKEPGVDCLKAFFRRIRFLQSKLPRKCRNDDEYLRDKLRKALHGHSFAFTLLQKVPPDDTAIALYCSAEMAISTSDGTRVLDNYYVPSLNQPHVIDPEDDDLDVYIADYQRYRTFNRQNRGQRRQRAPYSQARNNFIRNYARNDLFRYESQGCKSSNVKVYRRTSNQSAIRIETPPSRRVHDSAAPPVQIIDTRIATVEPETDAIDISTVFTDLPTSANCSYAILDTGAKANVCGPTWYRNHKKSVFSLILNPPSSRQFRLGSSIFPSVGSFDVSLTTETHRILMIADLIVIDIPFLLGLPTLRKFRMSIILSPSEAMLQFHDLALNVSCKSENDQILVPLKPAVSNSPIVNVDLTTLELKRAHHHFGHMSAAAIQKALSTAGYIVEASDTKKLRDIENSCVACQRNPKLPRRPRVAFPEPVVFNRKLLRDLFHLDSEVYLHVICSGTHYSLVLPIKILAHDLPKGAENIFRLLNVFWFRVFNICGYLLLDRGKEFTCAQFREAAESLGIKCFYAATEAAWSMGLVEGYHKPIKRIIRRIKTAFPDQPSIKYSSAAMKTLNDCANLLGKCPTSLVIGDSPRPPIGDMYTKTYVDTFPRMEMQATARREYESIVAQQKLSRAFANPLTSVDNLDVGSSVMYFRKNRRWAGPGKVYAIMDKTIDVRHNASVYQVPLNYIKIYKDVVDINLLAEAKMQHCLYQASSVSQKPSAGKNAPLMDAPVILPTHTPAKSRVVKQSEAPTAFHLAKLKELETWFQSDAYSIVRRRDVPNAVTPLHTKWILTFNSDEKSVNEFMPPHLRAVLQSKVPNFYEQYQTAICEIPEEYTAKARLVLLGNMEQGKESIFATSPTASRTSVRVLLAATQICSLQLALIDVKRAFLRTHAGARQVYAIPPKEMDVEHRQCLKRITVMYGLRDASKAFFQKLDSVLVDECSLATTRVDQCFYINPALTQPGFDKLLATTTVDDVLIGAIDVMKSSIHATISSKFKCHPTRSLPFRYNGLQMFLNADVLNVNQQSYITELHIPSKYPKSGPLDEPALKEYRKLFGNLGWVSRQTRPDQAACTSLLQLGSQPRDSVHFWLAIASAKRLQETSSLAVTYSRLNITQMSISVYTDASYRNIDGSETLAGYFIFLQDDTTQFSPIKLNFYKEERVVPSSEGAKGYALIRGHAESVAVRATMFDILHKLLPIHVFVDKAALYRGVVTGKPFKDSYLNVDLHGLRKKFRNGDIQRISLIKGMDNPADSLTKIKDNGVLFQVLDSRELQCPVSESVDLLDDSSASHERGV